MNVLSYFFSHYGYSQSVVLLYLVLNKKCLKLKQSAAVHIFKSGKNQNKIPVHITLVAQWLYWILVFIYCSSITMLFWAEYIDPN